MSVSFNDLHDKLVQRVNGLLSSEDLCDWLDNNIEIKSYIPINKKYALISIFSDRFHDILNSNHVEESTDEFLYLMYDIETMFTFLFAYTDIIPLQKHRTSENYDLVYKSRFFNYILEFCEEDYDNLLKKCDRVSGIESLFMANQMIKGLQQPSVEEWEVIKDTINSIDTENLKVLKSVQEYNDPMMKKIISSTSKDEIKKVMSKK